MKRILISTLTMLAIVLPIFAVTPAVVDKPELQINYAQAQELFAGRPAKMVITYPGDPPGPGWPLYLIDFTKNPLQLEYVTSDGLGEISRDGTRITSTLDGKIYLRLLQKDSTVKTYVGTGSSPTWWSHPKTGDEYLIYVSTPGVGGASIEGKTYIQQVKKGTCEPEGPAKVLIEKYAFRGGRSPDGKYICTTQPGFATAELKPDAVENAFVKITFSLRNLCNGTICQDPRYSGTMLYEDNKHEEVLFTPPGGSSEVEIGSPAFLIPPPRAYEHIEWLSWSNHPDYIVGAPSVPDDWTRFNLHDPCVFQMSTNSWTVVAKKGYCRLWVSNDHPAVKVPAPMKSALEKVDYNLKPAITASWDAKLLARIKIALATGIPVRVFRPSTMEFMTIKSVDVKGQLEIVSDSKQTTRLPLSAMSFTDKKNIMLIVCTGTDPESSAISAFYQLASGRHRTLVRSLYKVGPGVKDLLKIFE
jgi:hypothetical protein